MLDAGRSPRGHAIEARVCAENPWRGHEPSAGTLTRRRRSPTTCASTPGSRAGTEVTANYDSLLAKVVAHGETRADALDRLRAALDATRIEGVTTNVDLLRAVVADAPTSPTARLSTSLLAGIEPDRPRGRGARRRDA